MKHKPTQFSLGVNEVHVGARVRIPDACVNLYGCTIGDDVCVGPFVEIQRGAVIGNRTKIQSHTFICEMVSIGDDCVIAHGVMFTNDRWKQGRPAGGNRTLWEPTIIGNRVFIGSGSTILPVRICDDVVIGAGSVVTKSICEPGTYAGNPARKLR